MCVSPVSEAAGSQVRKLTVLQSTFNQLVQCVMKERLVLSVHILYTLCAHTNTHKTLLLIDGFSHLSFHFSINFSKENCKQIEFMGSDTILSADVTIR